MSQPLSDDLLHAYVDGALSDEDRRAVEAQLALDAEASQRVRDYVALNNALHEQFDPVLDEAHAIRVRGAHRTIDRSWWPVAAALMLGVGIGFLARGTFAPPADERSIARQAMLAHHAYASEVRHPVEVPAAEEKHLVAWLSKRLDAPLRVPSLTGFGYQLLGGRLLPPTSEADPAPVALLMYENAQGKRLSLLVKHAANNRETAFRFTEDRGGARVFYWIDGPFGYALAGDLGRDELHKIARSVYQQLNP